VNKTLALDWKENVYCPPHGQAALERWEKDGTKEALTKAAIKQRSVASASSVAPRTQTSSDVARQREAHRRWDRREGGREEDEVKIATKHRARFTIPRDFAVDIVEEGNVEILTVGAQREVIGTRMPAWVQHRYRYLAYVGEMGAVTLSDAASHASSCLGSIGLTRFVLVAYV
jgi:hypothetical protein